MHEEKPLVSVCCLAYNHEKYIRQCLQSIVSQQTDFPFEVIVHDDASTDGTRRIIEEFANSYPQVVKPIYETVNQYQNGRMRHIYCDIMYPRALGDYIAYCECDDFWSSTDKLQKQVDCFLKYPNIHMCVHSTQLVSENGNMLKGETFPQNKMNTGVYGSYSFMSKLTDGRFFHTSSFLCRKNDLMRLSDEMPDFYAKPDLDDMPLLIYFGQLGDNFYLSETLSCYRRDALGSWTRDERSDREKTIGHKWANIEMYRSYDNYTGGGFHDLCIHWEDNERFMIAEIEHDFSEMGKSKYKGFIRGRSMTFRARAKLANFFATKKNSE